MPETQSQSQLNDVFMTRHSARIDSDGTKWTPLPGHSRDDVHLSPRGEEASQQLSKRLESVPLSHIVSSPFIRCLQTVAPIARAKELKIKIEPGLCEVLTIFPPGFWDTKRLAATYNDVPIDLSYCPVMDRSMLKKEGSDCDAADRSGMVATSLRGKLEGPILFCGHGASCLGIMEAFGGSGYVGYSSLTHFRWDQRGCWEMMLRGDVSHLSEDLKRQSLESAW
mmetsp:Transcript_31632/g.38725  ORF Transcript_31632/g.38725 Transcript_31632/m.38725 type:complete len:224 (+) Transcript_31632:91-762(+)